MPKLRKLKTKPVFKTFISKNKPIGNKLPLSRIYLISLSLGLVTMVLPLLLRNFIPPEVPLFYGAAQGQDQITGRLGLIIPGLCAITVTLLNTGFALLIKNKFLQQTLLMATILVSTLSLITILKIILL